MSTATTGNGTITLGSAVTIGGSAYQTFSAAGCGNNTIYSYEILDGTAWEIGNGTYVSTGNGTLTRTLGSSSTGSLLNLDGNATVALIVSASDASAMWDSVQTIGNISQLRSQPLTFMPVGTIVYVPQYYSNTSTGAGHFELKSGNVTENGGTNIVSTTSGFYWSRILDNGPIQPEMFGAVAGNIAASTQYGNLTQIQAVYPFATATTNTLDWLGTQASINNAQAIQLGSQYFLDQGLTCVTQACSIKGVNPGLAAGGGNTTLTYIGAAGNLATHKVILKMADASLGETPNAKYEVSGIVFNNGIGGSMTGNQSSSNYVDGLWVGPAELSNIIDCTFTGTLNDGVLLSAANEFFEIAHNNFYGVQRDAISIPLLSSSYTTTSSIHDNNFGFVGRYDILAFGSTETNMRVFNNYHQGTNAGCFYPQNPNWWVGGLIAANCFVRCAGLTIQDESFEAVSTTTGYWADIHLVQVQGNAIENATLYSVATSALGPIVGNGTFPGLTTAGTTYVTANGYLDLTDQRNISIGTSSSFASGTDGQNLTLKNISGMTNLFTTGGSSGSFGGGIQPFVPGNVFEDVTFAPLNIPAYSGTYITQVYPIGNASVSTYNFFNTYFTARNAGILIGNTAPFPMQLNYFDSRTESGSSVQDQSNLCTNAWAGNSTVYANMTIGAFEPFVRPTSANENGYMYQYISGGTSGSSEPNWASHETPGGNFSDGTATLMCVGTINLTNDLATGNGTVWANGQRSIKSATNASPTTGWYNIGDRAWARIPTSGFNGNVCTNGGNPGTWASF